MASFSCKNTKKVQGKGFEPLDPIRLVVVRLIISTSTTHGYCNNLVLTVSLR